MSDTVDYIVVGAGSAGCVLANRLSEDGAHAVCLLEAGPRDRYPWIHIPIGYGKTMFHKEVNWGYYTDPDPNMLGRRIYWPRGRTLGGSSAINGLIYIRGQRADYDAWAAAGNPGWRWEDCLPYFRRLEDNDLGESPTRGVGGPLSATSIKTPHPLVEAMIEAAAGLGVPRVRDFNTGEQEGAGYYQLTTRHGRRCSTAVAYLRPAEGRQPARADRRPRHGRAVRGPPRLRRALPRRRRGAHAASPARGAAVRRRAAIAAAAAAVRGRAGGAAAPARHRRGARPAGRGREPAGPSADPADLRDPPSHHHQRPAAHAGRARAHRPAMAAVPRRPLAVGINQGGLFCRVDPASATPDTQFHFATLSADMAGGKVHPFSGCTYSVCQLRPSSRGHVRLRSADPFEAPSMQPNYLSTELDRRMAVDAVKYARRLAAAEPLAGLMKREFRPGPEVRDDDEILHFCREYGATIFHPSGTAKMGPADDPLAVVDERLRVRGVAGLRVVDCSVMPTLVSGNTNAPVIMLAERAAEFILQEQSLPATPGAASLEACTRTGEAGATAAR